MSEKMREALIAYIAAGVGNSTDYEKQTDALRLAMDALAEQPAQGEAVARVNVVDLGGGMTRLDWEDGNWWHRLAAGTHALYTAPPAPSVPDGWKLVPIKPTDEMIYMMVRATANYAERLDSYAAMLNAAPEPRS